MRHRAVTIVLSLIAGVVIGAAASLYAQAAHSTLQGKTVITLTDTSGKMIAAGGEPADVKVFIVGRHDGRVVGKLMANVNGKWIEVQLATQTTLAGQ